ncbi:MAG TPA: hypothetical protein VHX20_00900 [Terracidiphilus sp.]|jgi:hypothetical protein|nr:hypothetical protein [Terracidiphilus sp.]
MNLFNESSKRQSGGARAHCWWKPALAAAVLAGCFGLTATMQAQVAPSATAGPFKLSAGGTGSGYYLQYGQQKLLGATAFVDADFNRGFGVEAEGRWLKWHQANDVHVETYSAGLRYHRDFRRFEPYAKGLIGFGNFNFPYNYAHGRYLTVTAGGGMDYLWTHRIYIRVADVEWQTWPQFTYGSMNSVGVSAGVRVGIF